MDDQERWQYVERRLIELSGELMAARLVANVSLDWLVSAMPTSDSRTAQIQKLSLMFDTALSDMTHIGGESLANDHAAEIARARCDEVLAKIASMRTKR